MYERKTCDSTVAARVGYERTGVGGYDDRAAPQRPGMWVRKPDATHDSAVAAMRHRYWFEQKRETRDSRRTEGAVETRPGDSLPGERGYVPVRERLRIMHQRARRARAYPKERAKRGERSTSGRTVEGASGKISVVELAARLLTD